jgi:hypothetical protein
MPGISQMMMGADTLTGDMHQSAMRNEREEWEMLSQVCGVIGDETIYGVKTREEENTRREGCVKVAWVDYTTHAEGEVPPTNEFTEYLESDKWVTEPLVGSVEKGVDIYTRHTDPFKAERVEAITQLVQVGKDLTEDQRN